MRLSFSWVSVASELSATLLVLVSLQATEESLWQIGGFDGSSEDLGAAYPFRLVKVADTPTHHEFRIPEDDWRRDWLGFHPGSANGIAGAREHSYDIVFPLASRPQGTYRLTIAVLTYLPRRPNLRIEINGRRGFFYLRPQIRYGLQDFAAALIPHYAVAQLGIILPTRYLKQGGNRLSLACVDDPSMPDHTAGTIRLGISGIFYDAIRLSHEPAVPSRAEDLQATVRPTVFYRRKDGRSLEVVEVLLRSSGKFTKGRLSLEIDGVRYPASLGDSLDFGERLVALEIPEWQGTAKARLRVEAGVTRNFEFNLTPARKWTVFVVPHTHLDIGFTDYQGKVADGHARAIAQAAELIRRNPDFRFSIDGSWALEQLLATRSHGVQNEVVSMIREGKIGLPAQYCNLLTGYASSETLIRSLYSSKALAQSFGLPFEYANITDVPSFSESYPSVLASAGIKYLAAGGNGWRAPFLLNGQWNEKSPFWWEGPDGKRVLVWFSRGYMQVRSLFGLPPSQAAIRDSLPVFLETYSRPDYKPNVVLIYGTQDENTDLLPETSRFVEPWNQRYTFPRLQYATFSEFFKHIDREYGGQLKTYRGGGGAYWEDGVAGDARFVAEDRQNQQRALSAETLSSLASLVNSEVKTPESTIRNVWRNLLLFAEHTWTAWLVARKPGHDQAVRQLEVKDQRATAARLDIDDLVFRASSQLANAIRVPGKSLVVFNSLSWTRSALVDLDLPDEGVGIHDLSTGRDVHYELLESKLGGPRVRFLAEDLPPVGYKCYAIGPSGSKIKALDGQQDEASFLVENIFYRLKLDPNTGAVASIFDKLLQAEVVDSGSPYKFNQFLYVSGGDGQTRIVRPILTWPLPNLRIQLADHGSVQRIAKTPYGHSITLRSEVPGFAAIATEVLLFDDEKKIEFINRVDKTEVTTKEAAYFAFPAAVRPPDYIYASQIGWVNPSRDFLKGAAVEWFAIQDWMAVHDDRLTLSIVPIDAPLASFGDINRGRWPVEFRPETSTIFSYVMNNYWDTNYRAMQGGTSFRYVVTSSRTLDAASLRRFAWNQLRPAETNFIMPQEKLGNWDSSLPPEGASFLEISNPDVVLHTWKPAEDGRGTILRLGEIGGRPATTELQFVHLRLKTAHLCTSVEDIGSAVAVENNSLLLAIRPHEIVTLRAE